jgi:gamma-glutamylcysteine synthetase
MTMKKIKAWFKCENPCCPIEKDHGYKIQHKGKKIKVCEEFYKKIRRRKKSAISENVHASRGINHSLAFIYRQRIVWDQLHMGKGTN